VERPINLNSKNVYEIMVKGDIDLSRLTDFAELNVQTATITEEGHHPTLFRMTMDQAGLVGLLRRIHGLGMVLLSIRRV